MKKVSYRNARKKNFTQISNSLLNDSEVTLQAKGLLSIFLSNSDNWDLNMKEIIKRSKNGRDAHYNILNELILLGYFARVQVFDKKFEEMIYIFSDDKEEVAEELERLQKEIIEKGKTLIVKYKSKKEKKVEEEAENKVEEKVAEQAVGENKHLLPENPETDNQLTENQYINNTKSNNTNLNNKDINPDTYIDTEIDDAEIDDLLKDSLNDKMNLPPATFTTMKALTNSYQEMHDCIGVILRAKKKVETERGIYLHISEDIDSELSSTFTRCIREIRRTTDIEKPTNYMFIAFYNLFNSIADFKRK